MGIKNIDINLLDFSWYGGCRYKENEINNKLENVISKHGQLQIIVVFKEKDTDKLYKIIDLYHVAKILKKLKYKEVICFDVGIMTLKEAMLLSFGLNIKFRHDIMSYASRLKELQLSYTPEEIEHLTDFHKNEIIDFPKVLEFDFLKYDEELHVKYNSEDSEEYF